MAPAPLVKESCGTGVLWEGSEGKRGFRRTTMTELFLEAEHPHVVAPAEDPVAVENILNPLNWTVGDNWWASDPKSQQEDGRWKLFVTRLDEYEANTPSEEMHHG